MRTAYTIYHPGKTEPEQGVIEDWPPCPGQRLLHELLDPILGTSDVEHVYVQHDGRRADMFVDECGRLKHRPRNDAATAIYRSAWLGRHPGAKAGSLPWIAGPAVLFHRVVWG